MDSDAVTLQITLEDVGGTSWWASLITTLTSQSGSTYLRFVGSTNGDRRYKDMRFPHRAPWERNLHRRNGYQG
jgi:hypothetical protein